MIFKYFSWKLGIDIIILDIYYNDIKLEWLTDPLSEFYHYVGLLKNIIYIYRERERKREMNSSYTFFKPLISIRSDETLLCHSSDV